MFVLLIERGSHYIFFAVSDGLPAAIYEHDYLKARLFLRNVLHTHSFFLTSTNWKNLHVSTKGNHYEIFHRMRGDQETIDRRGGGVNYYFEVFNTYIILLDSTASCCGHISIACCVM